MWVLVPREADGSRKDPHGGDTDALEQGKTEEGDGGASPEQLRGPNRVAEGCYGTVWRSDTRTCIVRHRVTTESTPAMRNRGGDPEMNATSWRP